MQPPPIPSKDAEHLRILAIFHYVVSVLSALGIGFLAFHYSFMKMVLGNAGMWEKAKNPPPFSPDEFFGFMQWFYAAGALYLIVGAVLSLMSGRFMSRRKARTFSIVVAGLMCLQIPFGTVLGVFTIVVLTRESVMRLYAPAESGPAVEPA